MIDECHLCRELHPLSKQFVMRLLFVQQAVPQAVISSWVTQNYSKELARAKVIIPHPLS